MKDAQRTNELIRLSDVSIVHLRTAAPPLTITSGLSLIVRTGEFHCASGRSGSGKSSLIRVVAGVETPSAGRVEWAGVSIAGLTDRDRALARRAHLGYVDQQASVIESLSAIDNVLLPALPTGLSRAVRKRAAGLLEQLGVASVMTTMARSLSGGERQRVCIARVLLGKPTAIVIDEPTASLDRASADVVISMLSSAAAEGAAVVVATHDAQLLSRADSLTRFE